MARIPMTIRVSKTMQEKQFEPLTIEATVVIQIESSDLSEEIDELSYSLEDAIDARFKARGILK